MVVADAYTRVVPARRSDARGHGGSATVALFYQRRVGWIVAVLTVGLSIGAVYGGFHYAVDIVAGALVGLSLAGVAWWIWTAEFSP